jgi:pyruvate dehydrogenase E1 component alpha subunit
MKVNGMDVLASHQAFKHAREWAIAENGPMVLEFVTYRYAGHS